MIISTEAKKQHLTNSHFYNRNTQQRRCRWNLTQHNKDHVKSLQHVIIECNSHAEDFSSEIWIKSRMPTVATSIQYSALEFLTTVIRQYQEMKGSQIRREEIKLSLFADNTFLYMENPKRYTHTHTHTHLLELINKFSKVAGYKLNIQTSVLCLHNDNKLSKKEMKKTILFIIF